METKGYGILANSRTSSKTLMSWVRTGIRAFTPLGPLDWGNLIASSITQVALAKNFSSRACAPLGLVKTQSWTPGANKIKIKIRNIGSQIMSKVINELRTSVFNLKFF